jgi:hypothetical protein
VRPGHAGPCGGDEHRAPAGRHSRPGGGGRDPRLLGRRGFAPGHRGGAHRHALDGRAPGEPPPARRSCASASAGSSASSSRPAIRAPRMRRPEAQHPRRDRAGSTSCGTGASSRSFRP